MFIEELSFCVYIQYYKNLFQIKEGNKKCIDIIGADNFYIHCDKEGL
jgi:hypothetical protein